MYLNSTLMVNDATNQINITYLGFEKNIQQKLECIITENRDLISLTKIPEIGNAAKIRIYLVNNASVNGINNIGELNELNKRILHFDDFADFESLLTCVRSGSHGCISTENMLEEIIPALLSVLQGKIFISPSFAGIINSYFKNANTKGHYSNLFTEQEHKLIQHLTTGALYKEIAWKMRISENTVRSHVRNIYGKLKVHSKTELTQKILSKNILSFFFYFLCDNVACLCY